MKPNRPEPVCTSADPCRLRLDRPWQHYSRRLTLIDYEVAARLSMQTHSRKMLFSSMAPDEWKLPNVSSVGVYYWIAYSIGCSRNYAYSWGAPYSHRFCEEWSADFIFGQRWMILRSIFVLKRVFAWLVPSYHSLVEYRFREYLR